MSEANYDNRDGFKGKAPNEIKTLDIDDCIYSNETPIKPCRKDGVGDQPSECPQGWKKLGSRCYYISTKKNTWEKSRQDCRDRGADLVIINSQDKQTFVNWLCGVKKYVWIGLTDSVTEGTWKWVDDTPLTTTYWNSREPNGGVAENCAYFYSWSSDTGAWWDSGCSDQYRWICEK
ncbi:C-type lectin domain family 4 member E [Coregonus clupeaformis]|uniref:C-type lectin domain family 4 member E n=1 Tax=Coregonus clupeaformis TaxID=59861 RepID=UPI001E1C4BFE|nr:C-type lectin domain family 4 member E [Coregonus clupeaformis]